MKILASAATRKKRDVLNNSFVPLLLIVISNRGVFFYRIEYNSVKMSQLHSEMRLV